ncbi:MAG: hypothetical protein AB7G13_16285 [Lautropia sp.]
MLRHLLLRGRVRLARPAAMPASLSWTVPLLRTPLLAAPLLAVVLAVLLAAGDALAGDGPGRALFEGAIAMPARIIGHSRDLPSLAARCSNCHGTGGATASGSDRTAAATIATTATTATTVAAVPAFGVPRLDREALTQSRSRRGGPPSRYDAGSFCALLQGGIDAAGVMIDQTMPRYRPDAAQCAALWAYLTAESAKVP